MRLVNVLLLLVLLLPAPLQAVELNVFDQKVKRWAESCRDEISSQLLKSGKLSTGQLFDTFYIPIPGTSPQKFHTQYDRMTDGILRPIIDKYLAYDKRLVFVVPVDVNGYLPTHNTRYQKPITGDQQKDLVGNRTKRIFNDPVGLRAAQNREPLLRQTYHRDTGETMWDISAPILVKGKALGWLSYRILAQQDSAGQG